MIVKRKLATVEEFERFLAENPDRRFELIDGEIIEMPPSEVHGLIAANITLHLGTHVKQHQLGRVGVEINHRMPQDNHNARIPDVSFMSNERALPVVESGSIPQMPDLAVEIKSPDETYTLMRKKAAYYIENGSRMVWLIYPEKRLVEIYQPDTDLQILTENDTIDGGTVLQGFKLLVSELFTY